MLCLKKVYRDELLQLAILLSLLRVDRNSHFDYDIPAVGIGIDEINGWEYSHTLVRREIQVHPKNLDSILLNYEQQVFDDLNSLGRYNRINAQHNDVTAYLLNVDEAGSSPGSSLNRTEEESASQSGNEADTDYLSCSGTERLRDVKEEQDPFSPADLSCYDPRLLHVKLEQFETDDLTQEDMDLIEVLWKQDVDMGFTLSALQDALPEAESRMAKPGATEFDIKPEEKLSNEPDLDNPWPGLDYTIDLETGEYVLKEGLAESELSADEAPSVLISQPDFSLEEALQLVGLNEDTFELPEENEKGREIESDCGASGGESKGETEESVGTQDTEQDFELLSDMIQTPQFHPRPFQGRMPYVRTMSMEQRWQDLANLLSLPEGNHAYHHHHHLHHHHNQYPPGGGGAYQHHGPYSHDQARNVLLHNATLAPPVGDLNSSSAPYPMLGGASNVGSAVATSMNLTNSSEPMAGEAASTAFKMESSHDMMYYQQNASTEMQNGTEGFLSSFLNDEDLQLMDMAMSEGMYTMRMLEGGSNGGERGADSDSAVSSMGSERVPSLSSDTEWMETNSDSGHTPADHYHHTDYQSKYRWYDYSSYANRQLSGEASSGCPRVPPYAQKKHQMYGKRFFQEHGSGPNVMQGSSAAPQHPVKFELPVAGGGVAGGGVAPSSVAGLSDPLASLPNGFAGPVTPKAAQHHSEMKYSCSVEFTRHHLGAGSRSPVDQVIHNHTYHLPPEHLGSGQKPLTRDKKGRRSEDEHLSRDEKRARALSIPISVDDIINLPMDEFNERLSKYDLSESQLSLIRDIRRRGKNKVAAQNCRKRKLDQIMSLADEVQQMRDRKTRLHRDRDYLLAERQRVKNKFSLLYKHVFQALRDPDGHPYSPYEWSLQQSADGNVLLVPRPVNAAMMEPPPPDHRPRHKHPDPRNTKP